MKWYLVLIIFIVTTNSWAVVKNDKILIPEEIVKVVKQAYNVETEAIKPARVPIEVIFKGEGLDKQVSLGPNRRNLDMARFISPKLKDFYFSLQTQMDFNGETRLFFINRYQPLKIGKQTLGAPCDKSFVIQSKLDDLFDSQGIKVSVPSGHYLNVIGGDYLLTHKEGDTLYVGYFKLRDSRWVERLCKISF